MSTTDAWPKPLHKITPQPYFGPEGAGRWWKYLGNDPDGVLQCLGCGEKDGQPNPMDPFTRFNRMTHLGGCPVARVDGGVGPV